MAIYRNTSNSVKTFYGIQIKPGETREFPGYVNSPRMIRVYELPKEPPKAPTQKSPTVSASKKSISTAGAKTEESKIKLDEKKKEEIPDGTDNNQ